MDRLQAEAALERAIELDASSDEPATFDRERLEQLGQELGVSTVALNQALDEVLNAPAGPLTTGAVRTIDASRAELEPAIDAMLRLRGLTTEGGSVWSQASGWWPDLYRFLSVTTLAVSLMAAGEGTTVRLVARLDRVWRGHLVAAVLLPLGLLAVNPGVLAWFGVTAGWVVACGAGYSHRRESIRRRLEQALRELARPDYRRHPW
jgi:hypothetical protein